MGFKIGVCGMGNFGPRFVPLFKAHPLVDEVVLADLMEDRVREVAGEHGIERTCGSLEDLLKTDVDAVGIFTQRWMHGPQAVQALKAGKHVYSAVPAAVKLEDLGELVQTVEETGLLYMLGETSYYRPQTIWCRERFVRGDFGRFVYGEGQYHHDMSGFYRFYMYSGGDDWKKTASYPPMLYPTHSVSHVLGVTFSRMTEVCCYGFRDTHPDGVFDPELSLWGNPYSDETGLFRTADGGMARINEFRRTGARESRQSIIGTIAAYEEQPGSAVWTGIKYPDDYTEGGIDYANAHRQRRYAKEDVSDLRDTSGVEITEQNLGNLPHEYLGKEHKGVSYAHPVERLPKEFVGMENGHAGSHQFLVQDFVEALDTGKLPPNNVWLAARYNAPGIVAHASAMRDGEVLKIPDYGTPPDDAELMDETAALR